MRLNKDKTKNKNEYYLIKLKINYWKWMGITQAVNIGFKARYSDY